MFRSQESSVSFPNLEKEIIAWWKDHDIYRKSLEAREGAPSFVFFEGPPTANGKPHPGHCLTRAMKDLYPRYRTMRGYRCERKAGWDTHGLPVEVEVCKELGIHSKEEIENYGIEPFIHLCQQSVFRYMKQWEELTERIGFWIRLDEAYVTYHQSFVESVWWALATFFKRGLLYQGHKIVWWWAQGGTALSSGEVGQGYREVADPSVFVRFPIIEEASTPECLKNTDLLVWTTTPWTLPSNQFAAVHPELEYSVVLFEGHEKNLVIASALVETLAKKLGGKKPLGYTVTGTLMGKDLLGTRYTPPFNCYYKDLGDKVGNLVDGGTQHIAWRVVPAMFVTTDSGTGLVHQAPAFGEDDFGVLQTEKARFVAGEGPDLICAVAPNGTFTDVVPAFQGRWVKEADKDVIRDLKERNVLLLQEQYLHDYPFCWRASDDPLIQYPRKSWFIRTSQHKEEMLANNAQINWLPEHIRDGRFGNFLAGNVDWALSRERYWGTPLPIWVCEKTGYMEAISNYDELLAKPGVTGMEVWEKAKAENPDLPDDLRVHKPYIDAITYDSPTSERMPDGSVPRMRRVPEVIDCWFDSGSMPFAQWGYPHKEGSEKAFTEHFPADFISEAIDQTRGWFYSQLAISTLLFGGDSAQAQKVAGQLMQYPHPFKNCIVLGLMLAEWWESSEKQTDMGPKKCYLSEEDAKAVCGKKYVHKIGKMSKSLRNYRSPNEIFETHGADALRWYFYANQAPWNSIIYSEQAIRDSMPEFMLRLWNVFGFFTIYANIDGFEPEKWLEGDVAQLTPDVLARGRNYRPVSERSELDRWMISELNRTAAVVVEHLDAYDNYPAAGRLVELVDALSNWYVRRSRDRFWSSDKSDANIDKWDAYWTLYECLLTLSKLTAPFIPFLSERIWQTLVGSPFGSRATESVHLCDYPLPKAEFIDETLSARMELMREIVSQGHAARMSASLKVRQPLARVDVVLTDAAKAQKAWLESHIGLICSELNVKDVQFIEQASDFVSYSILPDLKKLGPKLGKRLPALKQFLAAADGAQLMAEMSQNGHIEWTLDGETLTFTSEELLIRLQAKEGFAASQGKQSVVILTTELTDELIAEGNARDLVRAIQTQRKEMNLEYTARIQVCVATDSEAVLKAVSMFAETIKGETLCVNLVTEPTEAFANAEPVEATIAGTVVKVLVVRD